ncbi:hypothetical protein LH464_04325 [Neorhizobium sp. T786]|nr:hypothetical protein [Neorhizobium xiangyangii]
MAEDWLIRKNGYYYRPNSQGYTCFVHEAGRYTKEDAEAERDGCDPGEITIMKAPPVPPTDVIPEDIMREAMKIAGRLYSEVVDSDDGSHSMEMNGAAIIIGSAMMAERERAAEICREQQRTAEASPEYRDACRRVESHIYRGAQ